MTLNLLAFLRRRKVRRAAEAANWHRDKYGDLRRVILQEDGKPLCYAYADPRDFSGLAPEFERFED